MRRLQRINLMLLILVVISRIQNAQAGELEREYKPIGTWSGSSQELKSFAQLELLKGKVIPEAWQGKGSVGGDRAYFVCQGACGGFYL